jgi:hypothetical protein
MEFGVQLSQVREECIQYQTYISGGNVRGRHRHRGENNIKADLIKMDRKMGI